LPIAWGRRVSPDFKDGVISICAELRCDADNLMACMAFETARTFNPALRNPASGATGLIQFLPATAKGLGTTVDALAAMSATDQLEYVREYFKPWIGRLATLPDLYMAILWPSAIGKVDATPIFVAGSREYEQNRGLDKDRDGAITKAEAASYVSAALIQGRKPENLG